MLAGIGAVLVFAAGCGRDYPPPPSERNQLVLRFFDAMKNNDPAAASSQGAKLREMKYDVERLIVVQQSNSYVQQVQQKLAAGDVNGALEAVDAGIRVYPENRTLLRIRGTLRRLRNAPMLFEAMQSAKDSAAMAAALTAATTGLAGQTTPGIDAYFKAYRARIADVAAAEAKNPAEPALPVSPAGML